MTAEEDGITDDGRRWWFIGADTWPTVTSYAATSARSAIAAFRRDLADVERYNGTSRRETTAFLQACRLHVVAGPLTTPEAYELDLGWALAWEACRWTSHVPRSPATPEQCKPMLDDRQIESVRANTRRAYAPPNEQARMSQ